MNVQEDLSADRHRLIGGLFFCGLLLVPVLQDGFWGGPASQQSVWFYAYIVFISSALLLSLFSVDLQLSTFDVRRNFRLLGLCIRSRVLVQTSELKEIRRTTTAIWEHKGALSGTHIEGYSHQIQLITLDDRCIPLVNFWHIRKDPDELLRALAEMGDVLRLPAVNQIRG